MRSVTCSCTSFAVAPGHSVRTTIALKVKSGSSARPSLKYAKHAAEHQHDDQVGRPASGGAAPIRTDWEASSPGRLPCGDPFPARGVKPGRLLDDLHALAAAQLVHAGNDDSLAGLHAAVEYGVSSR
jgi:hypothetical protein